MKIKFHALNFAFLLLSCFLISMEMVKAGVPDGVVSVFSFLYGLLFPWKIVSIESPDSEQPTEESKDDEKL